MTYADDHPGYRVTTKEQATKVVVELTETVRTARAAVDVAITVNAQREAWKIWLVKHGAALGSVMAYHRCGVLDDVAYNQLRGDIMATMNPTLIKLPQE